MEGVSDFEAFGNLKFETNRIKFRSYSIWTNESWSKLQRRNSELDVPGGEPNFVPWLKRRRFSAKPLNLSAAAQRES